MHLHIWQLGKDEVGDFNSPCSEVTDFSDFKAEIYGRSYWDKNSLIFFVFCEKNSWTPVVFVI